MSGQVEVGNGSMEARLGQVADEFTDRINRGERPEVEDYARRYPEMAEVLRQVLPALQVMGPGSPSVEPGGAGGAGEALGAGYLGDFRIIREVGRGGMGVVYEAEQLSLGRRVALKVLPLAATMDPRQLQRFHNEARAAACLHHEHIVPVYAVGCERGVHFYAMQFIDGRTLAEVIAEYRQAPPEGEPNPPGVPAATAETAPQAGPTVRPPRDGAFFRRAAEWGTQAAEALEYAHGLGIVHRDIKPGNLMIDGQGKLWVTDFGLARTAADAGLTLTGDVLGTLRYMSPEQALAKHGLVDHRSDVYSLGVTLYELLTLRPAIGGRDRQEILNKIATEEPTALRSVDRAIPADLETVVLKALAKEPAERYATAKELVQDLGRFLADRPIEARRPTLLKRLSKLARRHKSVLATAAICLLLAVVGLAVSVVLIVQQRDKAAANAEEAGRQRERALANLRTALDGFDDTYMRWSIRYLAQHGRPGPREREFLTELLRFYDGLTEANGHEPELRHETARAHAHVAQIQQKLGNEREALAAGRESVRLFKEVVAEGRGGDVAKLNLAHAYREQALRHLEARSFPEAEDLLRQSESVLEELLASGPDNPEYLIEQARNLDTLGTIFGRTGMPDRAAAAYQQALLLSDRLVRQSPDNADYRNKRAAVLNNLGEGCLRRKDLTQARAFLQQALEEEEAALARKPDDPQFRLFMRNHWDLLGEVLRGQNEPAAATNAFKEALACAVQLVERHPGVLQFREKLAYSHSHLGIHYLITGRHVEAEPQFRRALAVWQEVRKDYPDQPTARGGEADARFNLASALIGQDKDREGIEQLRVVLQLRPQDQQALGVLSQELLSQPELSEAEVKEATGAARKLVALAPQDHRGWRILAWAHMTAGNWKEVVVAQETRLKLTEGGQGRDWFILAMAHGKLGQTDRARQWYDKAVAWMDQHQPKDEELKRFRAEAERLLGTRAGPPVRGRPAKGP